MNEDRLIKVWKISFNKDKAVSLVDEHERFFLLNSPKITWQISSNVGSRVYSKDSIVAERLEKIISSLEKSLVSIEYTPARELL